MSRRRIASAGVAILVIAVVALFTWRMRTLEERLVPRPTAIEKSAASANLSASSPARQAATATGAKSFVPASLPPLGTPLAQSYAQLSRDFAEGSRYAACRLAHDVRRCASLAASKKSLADWLAGPKKDAPKGVQVADHMGKQIAADEALCAGFDGKADHAPWEYLFAAAQMGHVPSMARFAIAPGLNPQDFGASLEGWLAYRAAAPGFLTGASDAGERSAVVFRALEHSGSLLMEEAHWGGIRLVPVDYFMSAKYAYAAQAFEAKPRWGLLQKLATVLSPEELARARLEAEKLVASWPADRLTTKESYQPGQTLPKQGTDCFEP